MQLYALDTQNRIVFADHALKQRDYFCLECRSIIRMRGGMHRQNHFYHVELIRSCRLSGKTAEHIQNQLYIQKKLPDGDAVLEMPFPEINRIADVVWLSRKIIFEIQCSPIAAIEVQKRNADYGSCGFRVIWILHDKRYNQWKLTAAELFLREYPHYFTSIDKDGQGVIYDQYDHVYRGTREKRLDPFSVSVENLKTCDQSVLSLPKRLPKIIQKRLACWPYCFSGDIVDRCLFYPPDDLIALLLALEGEMEKMLTPTPFARIKALLYYVIIRPYRLFFQILLERACR